MAKKEKKDDNTILFLLGAGLLYYFMKDKQVEDVPPPGASRVGGLFDPSIFPQFGNFGTQGDSQGNQPNPRPNPADLIPKAVERPPVMTFGYSMISGYYYYMGDNLPVYVYGGSWEQASKEVSNILGTGYTYIAVTGTRVADWKQAGGPNRNTGSNPSDQDGIYAVYDTKKKKYVGYLYDISTNANWFVGEFNPRLNSDAVQSSALNKMLTV